MQSDAQSLLRLHPAASGLSEDEIREIAARTTVKAFATDEAAIRAGGMPESLSLVIGGRFRMESPDGPSGARIANYGPGDQLGLMPLLHDEASPVDVIADEPSMTLEIQPRTLFRLMRQYPLMAKNLLRGSTFGMNDRAVRHRLHPRPRTITFLHTCTPTRGVVDRIVRRLEQLGETVGIISDDPHRSSGPRTLVHRDPIDEKAEGQVRAQLADWNSLDRIVFDVDLHCNDIRWQQLAHLYSYSQQIYLMVTPDSALGETQALVKVMKQASAWKHKLDVIWVLPPPVQVAPAISPIYELANHDYKVGEPPESGLDHAIERVVHALRGVRIGIALGGGAARGMSHYGVLDVFEKANLVIDEVAGTSVGAMLGVTYCSGYDIQYGIDCFTADLKLPRLYRGIRGGSKWYLVRKFRSNSWDAMLRNYLQDWRLEQLPIPIQTVGVDLVRGEEVIRKSGDSVDAILESINLPYLSAPICRDGQALVDGGMLNVIPADALVRSGCNYVIAVNVSTKVQPLFAGNTPQTPTERMKTPNVLQVWARLLDVQSRNLSQMGAASADFTISPDVAKVDIGAFEQTPEIARRGAEAASKCLRDLQQQLNQIDHRLFPLPT
ncbi:cyclic nucleotide-binding domain-containing protein [Roseiconus nitratireducens]|uniref:Cyclic nucleotide-binding domain-containing protein n=1 Tax=Roseiconus nitratireducens TaxID=2605748 RepID=A0A5M6DLZ5_9BACT|nr:patatin-like phospholipase family protein [Roseiconus nitratireducens]KAA5547150.1 cyclic nucleotide-binding domain-containing protein [Roseiconus nitratireducens]